MERRWRKCLILAESLRKARLDRGLSKQEMAETLGVEVSTVAGWQTGRKEPRVWYLPRIIAFLAAAVALLEVRTFSEVVEINATLARRGIDAMIEGSAKLSEIGVKAMSSASRPILSRLGEGWSGFAV